MKVKEFLVIEYAPSLLDNEVFAPVRMDGAYSDYSNAQDIAEIWASETSTPGHRIVVAEVVKEVKSDRATKSG
ncbi:hypothetical protein [Sulfitobacter pontiacus]|uniref:hypothetical protein n=1 Tax=Sulfitobacter pontiacus TaxID=60137 RepID=UPI0021A3A382|nr:hypothetical protein [Sulfitobacter pontiacus]UWR20199.1 hypothetical protein K3755_07035 [Sulfitobacter pontiacus]